MFLSDEPGDAGYNYFFREEYFYHVVRDMLGSGISRIFIEQLRLALLIRRDPLALDVATACGYSTKATGRTIRARLNKLPYFTDGRVNDLFFIDYYRQFLSRFETKEEIARLSLSSGRDTTVTTEYTLQSIMHILKNNASAQFLYDHGVDIADLNYSDQHVQYISLDHIGDVTISPYYIEYFYRCSRCKVTSMHTSVLTSTKCPTRDCGGTLRRKEEKDTHTVVYTSYAAHGDVRNYVVSLVDIPDGVFNAAVVVCRDDRGSGYYLFIVAVDTPKQGYVGVVACDNPHMVWNLVDRIDGVHQSRTGFHIDGMDYYKAAFIFMVVANAAGMRTYNILAAGNSKYRSMVPKWYSATLSRLWTYHNVDAIKSHVVKGSIDVIGINGQKMEVHIPGMFARNELAVLDGWEPGMNNSTIRMIKRSVGSDSIPSVSGSNLPNRTNVVVVADTYEKRWIETQGMFDLSDFALLFHINGNDQVAHFDGSFDDVKFDIYSSDLRGYIRACAKIDVTVTPANMDRARELVDSLVDDDRFRSFDRMLSVVNTLCISAMLCRRDHIIKSDFVFVGDLLSLTCRPVRCAGFKRDSVVVDVDQMSKSMLRKSVDDFINMKFDQYGVYNRDKDGWEQNIANVVSDLSHVFGFTADEASECVRVHVLASRHGNIFDAIVMSPEKREYFTRDIVGNISISELMDIIVYEFGRKKKIPKTAFSDLSDRGVRIGDINNCMVELRKKGWVESSEHNFKWIKP